MLGEHADSSFFFPLLVNDAFLGMLGCRGTGMHPTVTSRLA